MQSTKLNKIHFVLSLKRRATRKTLAFHTAIFVYNCSVYLATDNVNASRRDENTWRQKRFCCFVDICTLQWPLHASVLLSSSRLRRNLHCYCKVKRYKFGTRFMRALTTTCRPRKGHPPVWTCSHLTTFFLLEEEEIELWSTRANCHQRAYNRKFSLR